MKTMKILFHFVNILSQICFAENTSVDDSSNKFFTIRPNMRNRLKSPQSRQESGVLHVWGRDNANISHPRYIEAKSNSKNKIENLWPLDKMLVKNRGYHKATEERYFKKYNNYREILNFLTNLVKKYPNDVTIHDIGKSVEGRRIVAVKIGAKCTTCPVILSDCGIHAREWISPAECLYIISQLVENPDNSDMINKVKWYIIPLLNPDGYEYSLTKDKFWRKNRSKGSRCDGVDLNRNFDFHWGESGISTDECAEAFPGSQAFSEPESRALRDFALEHKSEIKLYLTFHSYVQMLLYPWGYAEKYPENAEELQSLGQSVSDAIRAVGGMNYTTGSGALLLHNAAGASDDWMMGVANVSLVYTIEITGLKEGFHPSENKILRIVKETFEGVKVFHNYIKRRYNPTFTRKHDPTFRKFLRKFRFP